MTRNRIAFAMLLVVAALASSHAADEWSRFRGPNGSGISDATTIPVKWSEADYNWKVKLPGGGHSSPVVWGDRIFVTCADDQTGQRTVACLRTSDGSLVWRKDFASETYRHHRDNSLASASPAVDANGVYATWTTDKAVTLLALSHGGKLLWRRNLGGYESRFGSGVSPIVHEDMVILPNDQAGKAFLLAVDAKTGKTRWQLDRKSGSTPNATPCVYKPKDGPPQLIFACSIHGMTSVDPKTGKVNWEVDNVSTQDRERCVISPIIGDGLAICGFGRMGRGTQIYAIRPPDGGDNPKAKLLYRVTKPSPYVLTPLVKDGLMFVWCDTGDIQCVRVATGKQVWRAKIDGATFYGSPVWVDGRLYAISKKGEVIVIAAADEFKMLARMQLGEKSFATPAISGGRMYLKTYSHLISIGGRK